MDEYARGIAAQAQHASYGARRPGQNRPSSLPGLAAEVKNQANALAKSTGQISKKLDALCARIDDKIYGDPLRHSAGLGASILECFHWVENAHTVLEAIEVWLHGRHNKRH